MIWQACMHVSESPNDAACIQTYWHDLCSHQSTRILRDDGQSWDSPQLVAVTLFKRVTAKFSDGIDNSRGAVLIKQSPYRQSRPPEALSESQLCWTFPIIPIDRLVMTRIRLLHIFVFAVSLPHISSTFCNILAEFLFEWKYLSDNRPWPLVVPKSDGLF